MLKENEEAMKFHSYKDKKWKQWNCYFWKYGRVQVTLMGRGVEAYVQRLNHNIFMQIIMTRVRKVKSTISVQEIERTRV